MEFGGYKALIYILEIRLNEECTIGLPYPVDFHLAIRTSELDENVSLVLNIRKYFFKSTVIFQHWMKCVFH